MLKPGQINQHVKKALGIIFNANIAAINDTDNAINVIDDVVNELAKVNVNEDIVNVEDYVKNYKGSQLSKNLNALE